MSSIEALVGGVLFTAAEIVDLVNELLNSAAGAPGVLGMVGAQVAVLKTNIRHLHRWIEQCISGDTAMDAVHTNLERSLDVIKSALSRLKGDLEYICSRAAKGPLKNLGTKGTNRWVKAKLIFYEDLLRKHLADLREASALVYFTMSVAQLQSPSARSRSWVEVDADTQRLERSVTKRTNTLPIVDTEDPGTSIPQRAPGPARLLLEAPPASSSVPSTSEGAAIAEISADNGLRTPRPDPGTTSGMAALVWAIHQRSRWTEEVYHDASTVSGPMSPPVPTTQDPVYALRNVGSVRRKPVASREHSHTHESTSATANEGWGYPSTESNASTSGLDLSPTNRSQPIYPPSGSSFISPLDVTPDLNLDPPPAYASISSVVPTPAAVSTPLSEIPGLFMPQSPDSILNFRTLLSTRTLSGESVLSATPRSMWTPSINVRGFRELNPLDIAAAAGDTTTIHKLLAKAVKPKQKIIKPNEPEILSAFQLAVEVGHLATVEALMPRVTLKKLKADAHPVTVWAAKSGSIAVLDLVLGAKADPQAKDENQWTALHWASHLGHATMVAKLLMADGTSAKRNTNRRQTALHLACKAQHADAALVLLEDGHVPIDAEDSYEYEALHYAVHMGLTEVVKTMLDNKKAKLKAKTAYGWQPLHIACAYGHLPIVQLLLARTAETEAKTDKPSYHPTKQTHDAVKHGMLLEAHWPHPGARPLHLALEFGHEDIAAFLITHGAKTNGGDSEGWRPLHYAAFSCLPRIVDKLLENGALPRAETSDKKTALGLGFRETGALQDDAARERVRTALSLAELAASKKASKGLTKSVTFGGRTAAAREKAWRTAALVANTT